MKPHDISVLLIEDNPDDHFFIKRMLTKTNGYLCRFELLHADNLADGLDCLSKKDIAIVLLDLSLPDAQGLETFLQTQQAAPDMPIVVMSGHDNEVLAAKAVALGAQDYLVKGRVDQDLLARSIIYAIERKQAEAESRASERKQAGEALKASEARYRDIIEKNADSILIIDVEGRIRFVNPAAEALFGCPAQALLATACNFPLNVGHKTEIAITRRNGSKEAIIAEMHLVETEWEGKTTYLASLRDITGRVQAQQALQYRAEFQQLIADISTRFMQLDHPQLEAQINDTLNKIGQFAQVDRSFILTISNDNAGLGATYEWCTEGIPARFKQSQQLPWHQFTWWQAQLARLENLQIQSIADLPAEARAERAFLQAHGIRSYIAVPLIYGSSFAGLIGFEQIQTETAWSEDTILLLKLVGEIIINTLERKRVEAALRQSELHYRAVVEDQTELICRFRLDGRLTFVNQAYCRYFGQDRQTMLIGNFLKPMKPEDQARVTKLMATLSWDDAVVSFKHPCIDDHRWMRWLQWTIRALPDEQGQLTKYQAVGRDVTAQIQAEETLIKLSRVVEQTADNVMITNKTGLIEYINPAFEAHTGHAQLQVIGRKPDILKSGKHEPEFYQNLWETILSGQVYSGVIINMKKSGELYYEAITITPIKDALGQITHFVSTGKDITERKRAEEILRHEATHDAMTGLPNRALFMRRLEQALAQAGDDDRHQFAVLFVDLDRFKIINDSLGHMVGDHLLIAVARRLEGCLRGSDFVARLGGDEFTILLDRISSIDDATQAANRIQAELSLPINLYGHEVFTTASIGIALSSSGYSLPDALLRDADAAMYRAKTLGKARAEIYNPAFQQPALGRLQLDADLRHAVERQELQLYYQPIVSLTSGRITAMEALVRWHHPGRGLMSPDDFISLAEETGLIVSIGEWILRTACQQSKAWQAMGHAELRVAVNISARQFQRQDLLRLIDQILTDTGLTPENLELEIAESLEMMRNLDLNISILKSLNELGLHISIDDFGNQYASLIYLKQFPIDILKIDKCFIDDVAHNPDAAAITAAIIDLAHNLRLKVIAEGVETAAQLNCLRRQRCDEIQGYIFSKPLAAEAATLLLQKDGPLLAELPERL